MMINTIKALESRIDYAQLPTKRWRASYQGFVSVAGDGDSPHACQMDLESQFDQAVAALVTRTWREQSDVMATPEPQAKAPGRAVRSGAPRPPAGVRPARKPAGGKKR